MRAWQRAYAGLMPASVLSGLSIEGREVLWRHRLEAGEVTMLVCERGKRVMGWLALGPSRDDDADRSVAEIYGLYVDPGHWRRRSGAVLWEAAALRLAASSFDRVTLWVLEGNLAARRFYEWAGFVLDPQKVKMIEREGARLPEVRYSREVTESP